MKKNILLLLLLALAMKSISQPAYNYAVNTLNIPLISAKKEATASVGWGRGESFHALEVQAAYSPIARVLVLANYFGARDKTVRKRQDSGSDFVFTEIAAGVYEKLPRGAASLIAGFGGGHLFSVYDQESADFQLRRWFIQPGISYGSKHFRAGMALRFSRLTYSDANVSYSIESPYIDYIKQVEKNAPMFLPEIGIQLGMVLKPFTIGLNVSSIFPDTNAMNFARLNTCLSVAFNFSTRKKVREE